MDNLGFLKQEKRRLALELYAILEDGMERPLEDFEKLRWKDLYAQWKRVAEQLASHKSFRTARADYDRRRRESGIADRRKQFMAIDFPESPGSERRSGFDRRDPFAAIDLDKLGPDTSLPPRPE